MRSRTMRSTTSFRRGRLDPFTSAPPQHAPARPHRGAEAEAGTEEEAEGQAVSEPRPCTASEAVARALSIVNRGGAYQLGTGDYEPAVIAGKLVDRPWTSKGDVVGSDCAGFAISWCYKLKRHRPGYNNGPWASVSDDLNCNSALEDAQHQQDLFELVTNRPQPGDLLVYPTFRITDKNGNELTFIGHVCIVTSAGRVTTWDASRPAYEMLDVAQCKGPNGRSPGVVATDGSIWSHHDGIWPKPEHKTHVIRARP